jgi:hypothetical protein
MKEIQQTFSEGNFKQKQFQSSDQTFQSPNQTFTITIIKRKPIVIICVIFIPVLVLLFFGFCFDHAQEKQFLSAFITSGAIFLCLLFYCVNALRELRSIELFDDKLVSNYEEYATVNFEDVQSYQINYYNGVSLVIVLNSGKKKVLTAGSNKGMEPFVSAFNTKMKEFGRGENLKIERKKSLYESKGYMSFLSVATGLYVFFLIVSIIKWHELPPLRLWIYLGPVVAGWVAYFKTKREIKNSE